MFFRKKSQLEVKAPEANGVLPDGAVPTDPGCTPPPPPTPTGKTAPPVWPQYLPPHYAYPHPVPKPAGRRLRNKLFALLVLTCLLTLLLPYAEDDGYHNIPGFLHLARYHKVWASFIMGMITMGVIRG